jgi:hypothetical protein
VDGERARGDVLLHRALGQHRDENDAQRLGFDQRLGTVARGALRVGRKTRDLGVEVERAVDGICAVGLVRLRPFLCPYLCLLCVGHR